MYKVWKKVKEMKNGYKLQAYPIKLENNDFPSGQDKAEAFVNLFAENSLSSNLNPAIIKFRKEEEHKEEYRTQFQTSIITWIPRYSMMNL